MSACEKQANYDGPAHSDGCEPALKDGKLASGESRLRTLQYGSMRWAHSVPRSSYLDASLREGGAAFDGGSHHKSAITGRP